MNTKNIQLYVLALIAFFIICALASCGSSSHMAKYERYQKSVEYPAWVKRNSPLFGWGDARVKRAESFADQRKNLAKEKAEEAKIQSKISQINSKQY